VIWFADYYTQGNFYGCRRNNTLDEHARVKYNLMLKREFTLQLTAVPL
jgi:hypothetical protein